MEQLFHRALVIERFVGGALGEGKKSLALTGGMEPKDATLKDAEIDLKFASNGLEAVDDFQSFVPDIVFMDISMPKMDGKQATAGIRAIEAERGGHVPIVAMTAHAMDGDSQAIVAAGIDHYLTKPLRKAEIRAQLIAAWGEGITAPYEEDAPPDQAAG